MDMFSNVARLRRHWTSGALAAISLAVIGGIGSAYAVGESDSPSSENSTYSYTGQWPGEAIGDWTGPDIKPWVKCAVVTYFKTEKTGSDMTECAGNVDVSYWRDFTGPVPLKDGSTYITTEFNIEGYGQIQRDGNNCPKTSNTARYVKCIKVSGPNGGQDGVVFAVENYSGTKSPADIHVVWDYGW